MVTAGEPKFNSAMNIPEAVVTKVTPQGEGIVDPSVARKQGQARRKAKLFCSAESLLTTNNA